jgi:hypothetical protein
VGLRVRAGTYLGSRVLVGKLRATNLCAACAMAPVESAPSNLLLQNIQAIGIEIS